MNATMSLKLTGFVVRIAKPGEKEMILRQFDSSAVFANDDIVFGAFGQPGDMPLGGMIVRPFGKTSAHFLIVVRPEFRRKGIGTRLMENLFTNARRHGTHSFHLQTLVHQDEPENAFYRKMGLTPERVFITYTVSIADKVLPLCSRIARRFRQKHAALANTQVVAIEHLQADRIAQFFADHYGGQLDHRTEQLHAGFYDASVSTAIVNAAGEILAASLYRTKPGNPAAYLDIVLVHPDHREGPMPLVLFEEAARLGMQHGIKDCVFEADTELDPFATGFAERCGCKPQWHRYRYGIQLQIEKETSGSV